MPVAGLSNGGGGRGGDLSFSMMSQCRSDAKHATLGAAACPLAKGNNLMHARKPAWAPEARVHARTHAHCQMIQLIQDRERTD